MVTRTGCVRGLLGGQGMEGRKAHAVGVVSLDHSLLVQSKLVKKFDTELLNSF